MGCRRLLRLLSCALAVATSACGGGGGRGMSSAGSDGTSSAAGGTAAVFRTACHVPASLDAAPQSLLDTGCFAALGNAAPMLVDYTVNGVLWADSAEKQRWFALPQGVAAHFDDNGVLVLPAGTGVFKSFARNDRLLETRLIFRDTNDAYQTITYAWNDALDDAELVPDGGAQRTFADGNSWAYLSRTDCAYCHNVAAGTLLGPREPQLDRQVPSASGEPVNQLDALVAAGVVRSYDANVVAWPEPGGNAPLGRRARAYLATNCAFCHLPGGASGTQLDWRYDTALADTHACETAPSWGSADLANAQILAPGEPNRSMLSFRMHAQGKAWMMPPVGHVSVDPNGTALIDAWITSLTSCDD